MAYWIYYYFAAKLIKYISIKQTRFFINTYLTQCVIIIIIIVREINKYVISEQTKNKF